MTIRHIFGACGIEFASVFLRFLYWILELFSQCVFPILSLPLIT